MVKVKFLPKQELVFGSFQNDFTSIYADLKYKFSDSLNNISPEAIAVAFRQHIIANDNISSDIHCFETSI